MFAFSSLTDYGDIGINLSSAERRFLLSLTQYFPIEIIFSDYEENKIACDDFIEKLIHRLCQ